jgi:hypothetical protein
MTIRPESVGGTPANRFIHKATKQLNIGPYFIDAGRNVRVLSPKVVPGRHTATAAHLTDPNRLYLFTMESGLYDVDARDLSFIVRYPDVQPRGDRFIFGYHGKGAYTGQGLLTVANNGRPQNQNDPTGPAGVLATWDGTTVAENAGSFTDDHLPNPESQGPPPVAPQPGIHRRLEPHQPHPALRSHRPRRDLRQPEPRDRPDLGHRIRREIRPPPRHGKPPVEPVAAAERIVFARRLARLAHRVAAHPPARSGKPGFDLSDAHARHFLRFPENLQRRQLRRARADLELLQNAH